MEEDLQEKRRQKEGKGGLFLIYREAKERFAHVGLEMDLRNKGGAM